MCPGTLQVERFIMERIDIQKMIDEAVAPLREEIAKLQEQIDNLDDNTPHRDHYHENYASADHVERSENSFNSRFYRLEENLSSLEYRISDVDRKAERAQSVADDARRSARGGW